MPGGRRRQATATRPLRAGLGWIADRLLGRGTERASFPSSRRELGRGQRCPAGEPGGPLGKRLDPGVLLTLPCGDCHEHAGRGRKRRVAGGGRHVVPAGVCGRVALVRRRHLEPSTRARRARGVAHDRGGRLAGAHRGRRRDRRARRSVDKRQRPCLVERDGDAPAHHRPGPDGGRGRLAGRLRGGRRRRADAQRAPRGPVDVAGRHDLDPTSRRGGIRRRVGGLSRRRPIPAGRGRIRPGSIGLDARGSLVVDRRARLDGDLPRTPRSRTRG